MPAEQAKNHWHGQPLPLAISPAPQLHAERLRRRQASLLRQRDELTAGHFLKRRPDHRQYQPGNLNSAGFPDVAIFLQNLPYKVVLKDASDVTVTTVDPYYVTDLKSVALTKVGSGSPSVSLPEPQDQPAYFPQVTGISRIWCSTYAALRVMRPLRFGQRPMRLPQRQQSFRHKATLPSQAQLRSSLAT